MIVDAQRMMAARMFEGPLEWSKARRVGGDPAPAGMFETRCLVPGLQGMCALVSKEWQQLFREWRDKEIEKRLRSMCRGLIYRALDMCDCEQYSYRQYSVVPEMSTLEDTFFVQGVKVVTLRFERTGKQKKHVLWTKVSRGLKLSLKRVGIPRHGWKSMLSDAELEQWCVWADAEFKAQFAWIQGCL
jgi:hypothetical protein